ncbi:TRAP transporter substrate-binding protein [Ancylobacter radicis]|uniref:TRAP transporter substrate-binding protein n=1 Tax=Ancylobacter radicis TaxID=2836179 RepID=A0ABS5R7H9_9HYPH|nr:TRAP transporter substrate-binding protein [Ancylobacter radicis]MBS9477638.1 TRAP transporter substrate-binding protein [Ancylobacter radicis]
MQIVGGLAGVTQYTRYEEPFWEKEITELSKGRIKATIRPLDAGGLRAEETLQLMRLGVVPFGTASLSRVSSDDPELNAFDLPVLNPDMATLRRTVNATRKHLADYLRQRYDIELLAVYAYPAQVIFCTKPFTGLDDLVGRKVRTSSVGQAELMGALGAVPVLLPFAEIVPALKSGVAECAITGTLSGYEIGLPGIATHVHSMAISWGLSFFGANRAAWDAVPQDLQQVIRQGLADLERRVWAQADADTQRGLACNSGTASCNGPPGEMELVPTSPKDAARRERLLERVVLPRWITRCGPSCARVWNTYLAPVHGVHAETE